MKGFPRIHSLLTLGLIHHQEFDYLFHPLRTDFVGESGSGKSMIADLLQLIFVGSEAFESATKGLDIRLPQTMVLKTSGRGTDMGYAILNVEVNPSQFIGVGIYIESTSRSTESLIIQHGYDFSDKAKLVPFTTPLSHTDLLLDNQILPLDQLAELLEKKGYVTKAWQRIKTFHVLLYQNNILPLDVSVNEKTLHTYAKILQSFSRGKTLEVQKSESLKHFLFGTDQGTIIHSKYKQAVEDLRSVFSDYDRNLTEIQKITQKQKDLSDLQASKLRSDVERKTYLTNRLAYWWQRREDYFSKIVTALETTLQVDEFLRCLHRVASDELLKIEGKSETFKGTRDKAFELFQIAKVEYDKSNRVRTWLQKLQCTESQLVQMFRAQVDLKSQKQALNFLIQELSEQGLLETFERTNWTGGYEAGLQNLTGEIERLESTLSNRKALLAYTNLDDPESLGYWAFNLGRALSLDEESVVVYFHDLPRTKPEEKERARFLPSPGELITALKIRERAESGFWLDLAGVIEFIPYVPTQLLNTNDQSVVRSHLNDFSSRLRAEVDTLKQSKDQQLRLKHFLLQLEGGQASVKAYLKKSELEHLVELDNLAINEAEFNEHIRCYHDESISQRYIDAEENSIQAQKDFDDNNALASAIRLHLEFINEAISKIDVSDLEVLQTIVNAELLNVDNAHFTGIIKEKLVKGDIPSEIKLLATKETNRLSNIPNAKTLVNDFRTAAQEEEIDSEKYKQLYGMLPDTEAFPPMIELPSVQQSFAAEAAFQASFKHIVNSYIPSEGYKFENSRDIVELSRVLLPDAFQMNDNDEENIIERIEHYLNSINDKNKKLNNRKLQKIIDLVEEVSEAVSTSLDTVRRLDNFFAAGDKQITGGYQVKLEREWSKEYPLTWIAQFKSLIESEVGIFSQQSTLAKRLGDFVTLEEKMKEAFYACGGSQTVKPSIQKLLDPNSYFDLSFTMKSASGNLTSGSTGQTYTAVALLCIARLSLIANSNAKTISGVRFMPIDEAEGLGSNFDMLHSIAQSNDYQIISMSVNPIGRFQYGEQYIYMLHKNLSVSDPVNYAPFAVFNSVDVE